MTEHVEVVQRLRRIETKLDAALECNEDHEHRLRSVENKQWGMSGAAAVAQLQDMTELRLITGRTRKPLLKKLNPIWWFQNDDEEQTAPWYKPEWPQWRRDFYWNFLRNPLQNFRCYVVGVQDRNYSVWGRAPVMTVQRNDLQPPERGFQWCVLAVGRLRLPFVSYSGRRIVWYLGWQPSGFFGAKFNLHHA